MLSPVRASARSWLGQWSPFPSPSILPDRSSPSKDRSAGRGCENISDYKVHFGRWNGEYEPLDEWVSDRCKLTRVPGIRSCLTYIQIVYKNKLSRTNDGKKAMSSQFEWDEEKDRTNRAKHGIGFEEAKVIFAGPVLTAPNDRQDYGEKRFISYGPLGALVVVAVVHTSRGGRIRLISARKAGFKERQAYYEYLENTAPGN